MKIDVQIYDQRLDNEEYLPKYATAGSAGMDLRACIDDEITLRPGYVETVSAGLAMHIKDPNYFAMITPRSGLGTKNGIVLANLSGIIDSDYQGLIKIALWNRGHLPYTIRPMERVAQLLILPVVQAELNVVHGFSESTERGAGGFGSSGTN